MMPYALALCGEVSTLDLSVVPLAAYAAAYLALMHAICRDRLKRQRQAENGAYGQASIVFPHAEWTCQEVRPLRCNGDVGAVKNFGTLVMITESVHFRPSTFNSSRACPIRAESVHFEVYTSGNPYFV